MQLPEFTLAAPDVFFAAGIVAAFIGALLPENPYSRRGASGLDCSSLRKIEVSAEDAARQIRRHGQGSRVGSSRSAFHNTRSAMVIAARSDDPECPSPEVAGRQCRHMCDLGHE
jgi:hypothetical protein